ncbi:hypothetical protein BBK36DRAFT_1171495 [Trichoderma citrinoviride]|uniref:Zn(2)-C6 fungal-type domain-containing protein n=1 Tax=Trichoderma citrinoviride TaxID=58853 RepID=A0A2T4B217_9HYPO|nr:hypothetical protein BBK36DRAFT_1171495 [Trichoderma citrinoviride]PTB63251.1 hypothetical protein BBK36DRAFT_1171495 [Trichoderma citrinoviride]
MADAALQASGDNLPRKRILAACEACRDNKIRCRPSDKPGVCRNFEEGSAVEANPQLSAGPSKSFTIDFNIPLKVEVDKNIESLRDAHANFFDNLVPPVDGSGPSQPDNAVHSLDSTPESTTDTYHHSDFQAKPSFNLASAESLLASFHSMLSHFPCIRLDPDASVSLLAASRPFVLLAILAAASGSRSIQGNSLYDEEFRRILGLKFVACGERSLEILQGILIYCAWYPFHIRPRNKQPFRYLCMATEVIHDMGLDRETQAGLYHHGAPVTTEQLDRIRSYLGCFYLASTIPREWQSRGQAPRVFSKWTEDCCKMLECSGAENDAVLASLVRLSSTGAEALRTINDGGDQTHQQSQLILLGLKAQLHNIESCIPPHIASTPVIYMQSLFVHLCLQAGALFRLTRLPLHLTKGRPPLPPESSQLYTSVDTVRQLLTYVTGLDETIMAKFSTADWCRFISSIILAIRLTLATPECPEFDISWARSRLQLDAILETICEEKGTKIANQAVNVLSAMRAILSVVRDKYNQRLYLMDHRQEIAPRKLSLGCPMLDGSMDAQLELWQSTMDSSLSAVDLPADLAGVLGDGGDEIFQDLWGTTAGWTYGALPQ